MKILKFFKNLFAKGHSRFAKGPSYRTQPIFSNEAEFEQVGASNEAVTADDEGWIRLVTFGDHKHPNGLQRLTRRAADKMVSNFRSFVNQMIQKFKGDPGLPIYIGHPDDAQFANQPGHQDTRAHAWIIDMQSRDDGLYIKPKWSNTGKEILDNAHFKYLSPRWMMNKLGQRLFEPIRLISVGLTNNPNILGDAVANEQQKESTMKELLKKLLEKLGFSNEQATAVADGGDGAPTEEDILGKVVNLAANAAEADKLKKDKEDLEGKLTTANEAKAKAKRDLAASEESRKDAETLFTNERKGRIGAMLDLSIKEGRITQANRKEWEDKLEKADGEEFTTAANELSKLNPTINTRSKTGNLGERKPSMAASNEFTEKCEDYMRDHDCDWETAWSNCKTKHKELYDQMQTPEPVSA